MGTSEPEGFRVVSPKLTIEALRSGGYKSTSHALAELIDNSIEARVDDRAVHVEVFVFETSNVSGTGSRIDRIAVLDDGIGMDPTVLRRALKFGDGTRRARKGIGRFGMGLPYSSISQCTRVDVWSWTNGPDNANWTYLDLEALAAGMEDVPEPKPDPLPREWHDLSEALAESGTLVVWSKLDRQRMDWRTAAGTLRNTELEIGRIYRRFIADGRATIRLIPVRDGNVDAERVRDARPNDPLYLMPNSSTPDPFSADPMFEPAGAGSSGIIGVEYFDIPANGETHRVTVRSSVAKRIARRADLENSPWPRQYKSMDAGHTPWGRHAGKNIGVSLVRAGRELELNEAWVIDYDPRERWWGIEVDFPPALDEVFGVTNNKQYATTFTKLSHYHWTDMAEEGETYIAFKERITNSGDPAAPLLDLVTHLRERLLTNLREEIKAQTRGSRQSNQRYDSATQRADFKAKMRDEDGYVSITSDLAEGKTEQEKYEEQVENLTTTHHLSRSDAEAMVKETVEKNQSARMLASSLPNSPSFFDVEYLAGLLQVTLNTDHPVYDHLVAMLDERDNLTQEELVERLENAATAFRILLYSWARLEDEVTGSSKKQGSALKEIRFDWGRMARRYMSDGD